MPVAMSTSSKQRCLWPDGTRATIWSSCSGVSQRTFPSLPFMRSRFGSCIPHEPTEIRATPSVAESLRELQKLGAVIDGTVIEEKVEDVTVVDAEQQLPERVTQE
jgi:hypothetical protein